MKRRRPGLRLDEFQDVKELVLAAFKSRRKRLLNNLPGGSKDGRLSRPRVRGGSVPACELKSSPRRTSWRSSGALGGDVTDRIVLWAFAKVNYALEVRGLRDDGYHEISSVFQSVSLADELEIERSGGGFELIFEPDGVEVGPLEENTVYKAWALLWEASGHELPARIRLHKKIPAGAGLGGGSADAAAVLVGMNELFDLGLEIEDLRRLGARIGADVPFCLSGGTALGEGVGECSPHSPLLRPTTSSSPSRTGARIRVVSTVPTTDAARRAKHPRSRLSRRSGPAALRRSPEPSAATSSPLPRIWYRRWRRTSARCCKPGRSGPR